MEWGEQLRMHHQFFSRTVIYGIIVVQRYGSVECSGITVIHGVGFLGRSARALIRDLMLPPL